ncbi:hypothetical protein Y023_5112 [Burkholderia pseudomallei A79D]|nr:hypothetical protein Y023_5112 [Burkholderia pseudomallei A79D]KGX97344.1 hypothetical protein X997_4795 [Burkholderia pseudomallei A79C]
MRRARQPGGAILDRALQTHRALGEAAERRRDAVGERRHLHVAQPLDLAARALPPDVGRASAVRDHVHAAGSAACLRDTALVGLPDVDPYLDRPRQVFLPKIGLVGIRQPLAELEPLVREQRERGDTHHHPLVRFGRVTGDGERVIGIVVPVHVGDLQLRLVDRRFERHSASQPARAVDSVRGVMIPNARCARDVARNCRRRRQRAATVNARRPDARRAVRFRRGPAFRGSGAIQPASARVTA